MYTLWRRKKNITYKGSRVVFPRSKEISKKFEMSSKLFERFEIWLRKLEKKPSFRDISFCLKR